MGHKARTLYTLIIGTLLLGSFFPFIALYRVCVFCILLLCLLRGKAQEYVFNPYYLFALTPISLLVYTNISPAFMLDLTVSTWRLASFNMLAFVAGLDIVGASKPTRYAVPETQRPLYTYALILVTSVPALYYSVTGSLFPLPSFVNLIPLCGVTYAIRKGDKRVIATSTLLFLLPSIVGHTSKTAVLTLLVAFLVCWDKFYGMARMAKWKIATVFIGGALMMIFAFTFANKERGTQSKDDVSDYYDSRVEWDYDYSLFMPYMYFCTPWTNVQYVMDTQDTRTNGLFLMKPFLNYAGLEKRFESDYELVSYSSFNTFTFITVGFKDWGYRFSFLTPLLLGLFVKKVYGMYCANKSPLLVWCYVYVAQATAEMFFSNHFLSMSYPFSAVFMYEAYKYFFCKKRMLPAQA